MSGLPLLPRITLVGSGRLGFSLTDPHDSHVYLLDGGDDAVLIDAGCGLATDRIAGNIGAARASRILLTHAHADHAGGAASLAGALDAQALALAETASIVAAGDEERSGLHAARDAGVYPSGVRLVRCPVDELDGAPLRVGDLSVEVLPTPGHAAGHACFLVTVDDRRVLFSGDLVFSRGRVAVLATPDTDLALLAASLRAVHDAAPDVLLPGHGTPVLHGASDHLRTAVEHLDRHQLPPGLLP